MTFNMSVCPLQQNTFGLVAIVYQTLYGVRLADVTSSSFTEVHFQERKKSMAESERQDVQTLQQN